LLIEALEPRVVLDGAGGTALTQEHLETPAALEQFESAAELQRYLIETAVQRWEHLFGTKAPRWDYLPFYATDAAVLRADAPGASGFETTNVQVAGVDEGDVVKTDGEYIYITNAGRLSIVDTRNPADLQLASQVSLEGWTSELFVIGDRLTVISTRYDIVPLLADSAILPPHNPGGPRTTVTVYDISDRSDPTLITKTILDGWLITSRRIDHLLYLVTSEQLAIPMPELICEPDEEGEPSSSGAGSASSADRLFAPPVPWPEQGETCFYETKDEYLHRVAADLVTLVLPNLEVANANGELIDSGFVTPPGEVYKPTIDDPSSVTSIVVFDLSAEMPAPTSSASVVTDYSSTVYASGENIYLASLKWNERGGSTQLQQFSIDQAGALVDLVASGAVPGTLLNQFSLDEYQGHLRVVTSNGWAEDRSTSLSVLRQTDGSLDVVGWLAGIAPGESVFATRFLGERAFVVTFRQIDPLFTFDLSDPAHPTLVGELEIPGFSNYLHPVGADLLLGFGRDGGRFDADPQLSLFDVSDLGAPRRIDQIVIDDRGWSWSEAFHNHHAFSFFADSGVVVVPIDGSYGFCNARTGECSDDPPHRFVVARVEPGAADPLHVLGEVGHATQVLRSLRIGDLLFTISSDTVKANHLLDPATQLDALHFGRLAAPDDVTVDLSSERERLDVLANDHDAAHTTIVAVSETAAGGGVAIAEDGKGLLYRPPSDPTVLADAFTYTVESDGRTDTASVDVQLTWERVQHRMIELARADLAHRLGVPVDTIHLSAAYRETWPDSCLGVASAESMCAQVLTPGFRIYLQAEAGYFTYHTDAASQVVLAESFWRHNEPDPENEEFPGDGDVVRIRVEIVDETGNPVSMLHVGDKATLRLYAQDLREVGTREGVWAAYADVEFPAEMVADIGPIDHGGVLLNGVSGELTGRGRLGAVGGFDIEISRPELDEVRFASIPFVAAKVGGLQFSTKAAAPLPLRDSLVRGSDVPVPTDRIDFGQAAIEVAANWHNTHRPTDTNEDGSTSPVDALLVVNYLHEYGSERLGVAASRRAMGEDAAREPFKIDVNGDDYASPLDVLLVINALEPQGLVGEGEAVSVGHAVRAAGPDATGLLGINPSPAAAVSLRPTAALIDLELTRVASQPLPVQFGNRLARDVAARSLRLKAPADEFATSELDRLFAAADEVWSLQ